MPQSQIRYIHDLVTVAHARLNRLFCRPVLPRLVTYCVTYRCNCSCSMCEMPQRAAARPEELCLGEIEHIFTDPAFSRLDVIRFTGGEPFLRKDIGEIAAAVHRLTGVRMVYIITNGSRPDRVADFVERLMPCGIDLHIQVSLDAASGLHDRLRGLPGLFDRVRETLEVIRRLREKWRFEAGINQTVSRETCTEIEKVGELAGAYGCAHNITLAARFHEGRVAGRARMNAPLPFVTLENLDKATVRDIYSRIDALKRRRYVFKKEQDSSSLRDLLEGYLNEGGRNRLLYHKDRPRPQCTALFTHFRLLPDGGVVACSIRCSRIVGSLRKAPLTELWLSDAARRERREVAACAGCWSECDIAPSIFYSGGIIAWGLGRLLRTRSGRADASGQ